MKADGSERGERCCCFCEHNIRSGEATNIKCYCDLDGHYIGYISCFENWCKHWKRRKGDNAK